MQSVTGKDVTRNFKTHPCKQVTLLYCLQFCRPNVSYQLYTANPH